jgi:hypothetical protein
MLNDSYKCLRTPSLSQSKGLQRIESGDVFVAFSATAAQTRKLHLRSGLAL